MVKINDTPFGDKQNNFNYPFRLDDFQKHALNSINNKHNTLITAHTGSGKTLPAEYALQKLIFEGKRVIYTSPIKSLSNQKYYEFKHKFPNITFGLITGDIKCNPCAQCLIMTTEILRNTLFEHKMKNKVHNMFEMDFNNELGCIVYDEIHYINDSDRGRVWEESIMMTPTNTILVMLSATVSKVERFAEWIEETTHREVEICPTNIRVVPLNHYIYINAPESALLRLNPETKTSYLGVLDKLLPLKNQQTSFHDSNYYTTGKFISCLNTNRAFVKPSFTLNKVTELMKKANMLPAICFVFSRKLVEKYANMINVPLIDNALIIENRVEYILKHTPNNKDYIESNDYKNIMKLLRRGIAIHHSGLVPVLKEIIELLFSEGLIKLLFATETFAVGVNMPTKTVLFTNLQKISNNGTFRNLYSQEYTQMAGRAGRRGLDAVGFVIHLSNLNKELPSHVEYKQIISGTPQEIRSKFKIHNNLILRLISSGEELVKFTKSSMIKHEFTKQLNYHEKLLESAQTKLVTPNINDELIEYYELCKNYNTNGHTNKGKKIFKKMRLMEEKVPGLEKGYKKYICYLSKKEHIDELKTKISNTKNYIDDTIYIIKNQLIEDNFLKEDNTLTPMGVSATLIQEGHSLILSELIHKECFSLLDVEDIIAVLSSFAQIRTNQTISLQCCNDLTYYECLKYINRRNAYYQEKDERYILDIAEDYTFQLNLCSNIEKWCRTEDNIELSNIINELNENHIFSGEFIKAVLKINAIAKELSCVCDLHNLIELKQKLDKIPSLTLKHIVSNFSLYV